MKKAILKVLCFAVSLVMMFGVCAPVISAMVASEEETGSPAYINYVSLGDSMTNGYGLEGYNGNNGVADYGDASYANQFAEWLGETKGCEVNHAQLAMSAMRAEDLHWLLEVDYENEEVQAVINELQANGWDAELWYSVFTNGDYWTWFELVNNYRFDIAAAYIEGLGDPYIDASGNPSISKIKNYYTDLEALTVVAEMYQKSVAEADIISLGMGNGNFGVFMFGRILEAVGFSGEPEDAMIYDVQDAIRELDPKQQKMFNELINELFARLEENGFEVDDGDDTVTSKNEALVNTVVYTAVSYVLNYAGSVEAMLQLNPDAEVILVGLMNTFSDEDGIPSELADLSIGDMLEVVFTPLNAFIAALPTYMQVTKNSVYSQATFYYAEAADVECIVDTYGNDFINAETGKVNRNSIVRDRFYQSIVKDDSNRSGMIWGLLNGVELAGVAVVDVTKAEIFDYQDMSYAEKAAYAAANPAKAVSIAVYLAFEQAVIATADSPVTLNSILDLELSDNMFGPVMESFAASNPDNAADIAAIMDAIYAVVAAGSDGMLTAEQVKVLVENDFSLEARCAAVAAGSDGMLTAEQVEVLYEVGVFEFAAAMPGVEASAAELELAYNYGMLNSDQVAQITALQTAILYVSMLSGYQEAIEVNVARLKTLLTLPEMLGTSLENTAEISGLLGLFGRCVVGNGLGGHPSVAGHNALAEAVIKAYDEEYTAQKETIKNLLIICDLIAEYYDEAYAYAYDKAEEEGMIELLNEYLDVANDAIDAADAWVLAYSDYIRSEEFAQKLQDAVVDAHATIEALRALINNADEIDAESYDYLMALAATLETDLDDLVALLGIAVMDAGQYLDPKIEALNAQAEQQIAILNAQVEKQIITLNAQAEKQIATVKEGFGKYAKT